MAKKPTGSKQVTTVSRKTDQAARAEAAPLRKQAATPTEATPAVSVTVPTLPVESQQPDPEAFSSLIKGKADAQSATGQKANAPVVKPAPMKPSAARPRARAVKAAEPAQAAEAPAAAASPVSAPASAPSPAPVATSAKPESRPVVRDTLTEMKQPEATPDTTPEPEPEIENRPLTVPSTTPEPALALDVQQGPEPFPEQANVEETSPEPVHFPPAPSRPSLFIVQITPELAAVAKVGGLADVVFGLSRELAIRGNHVEIILPKYDSMRYDQIFDLHVVYQDLWVPWYDGAIHCTVFFGFVHDRKCFFIEPHSPDNFFNRGRIYGFKDDVLRYAFFSRAAMEFLWKSGKHPDVIHCHDWQTALVPVFLYEFYQTLGMTHPRVCLTIHNFAHQGVTGIDLLHATGLHRPERFFDQTRMADNRHPKALNLLKGGIVYANFVTTVSPRYAFETKDQGQGFGLEPTLHTHHIKYGGVVNGIDYDVWNPEIDRHIPVHYSVESIDGKYDNKRALRHRLMLADNEKPIVAFIGRLDPQKGLDLVRHAIFYTLERGGQFVLLGSSPDDRINGDFWGLKQMLNDSPDCHLEIGFDEDLSHLIYAGADMMLVPSRFEPCGLTQLISLRYGTIPVVRAIGGLADTVFDKDYSNRPLHERNGYVFQDYDLPGLESALGRAIACYRNHPDHFRELMKNAMRSDYSWNVPGQDYLNIYDYIRDSQ
ncbi:glycogen synthase GlgA [Thiobaca trueperi]|uniref:Glycogen synthase n=1 Tax=Thiobaca trueperi TaxID=127458 RepID=A0A4R3N461_9GAMM|nr:glycogen synthase GlgA [Thiobaca trueperi]TCT21499.1 starch synthase [Thiobaca trueperi]